MAKIGITLRSARIQRGLTIEQVAQDTRISARFLEALEAEAFGELPAPVYVRGFLRSYATYLRLEPQELLEQLDPSLGGSGTTGADEAEHRQVAGRRADPFRPAPPMTAPPPPSRPRLIGADEPHYVDREPSVAYADPFSARRAEPETPLDPAYETPYRRGRVGGVLVERGAVYEPSSGGAARVAAIVGGALILLVVFAGIAMVVNGSGDDDDDTVPGGGSNTPVGAASPTIAVVGAKTGTPSASATVSPSISVTASATAGPGGTTTPTQVGSTTTTTATATQAAATSTPTATPVPPTPTPTLPLPPSHGSLFQECPSASNGQPNCGSPMLVVCPPGQVWFVDYNADYPKDTYGWPSKFVTTVGQAITAGESGCTS